MGSPSSHLADSLSEPLTRREREVLALLAQGLTAPEIAIKLTIAVSSVKTHIQHVYSKLGVTGRRQAVARAQTLGLLPTSAAPSQVDVWPAPRVANDDHHNLPVQVTRFFGRERELTQLKARLSEHRLVTLIGTGGVGKTRLSLQLAETSLPDFAHGVWLVELAALSDPELVAQRVATALRVRVDPRQPIEATLVAHLSTRQLLLVLDNCEHVVKVCAKLAELLLRSTRGLKILATSREPLKVSGEVIHTLSPLVVPNPEQASSVEIISNCPSVRLFVDRARLMRPDYQVTPSNADALVRICRRLDGIPLAIEMAAARINLLGAEDLAAKLGGAVGFLGGHRRTAVPKDQTLQATFEWSYQLLTEPEQLLLQRLSVFAGGCTLEAAEAVCSGEGLEAKWILDLLTSLVAKSIVLADRRQGEVARYSMLEMVRQFAREKLGGVQEAERLRRRHRDYTLSFLKSKQAVESPQQWQEWTRRLLIEVDNVRLALEWSLSDTSNVEAAPKILIELGTMWPFTIAEHAAWCDRAIKWCQTHASISPELHADVLGHSSGVITNIDLPRAVALAAQAVEMSRTLSSDSQQTLLWAMLSLSRIRASLDVADQVEQSLAELRQADALFEVLTARGLMREAAQSAKVYIEHSYARLANKQGRYADAKRHAAQCLQVVQESGIPWGTWEGELESGEACLRLGEYEQSRDHYRAAQQVMDDFDDYFEVNSRGDGHKKSTDSAGQSNVKCYLGICELRLGNVADARALCHASLQQAFVGGHSSFFANALGLAAGVEAAENRTLRAATLSGASRALFASSGRKPWEDFSLETVLPGWRILPERVEIERACAAGQAMSMAEAMAFAVSDQPT